MFESFFLHIFGNVSVISRMHFWIGLSVLIGVAFGVLYFAIRYFRHARILEDTPTSKIRSAAQGYVELVGIQKNFPQTPYYSKLSGSQCTWYEYAIAKKIRIGKETSWKTIEYDLSRQPFLLVGKTGECVIYPEFSEIVSPTIRVWQGFKKYPKHYPNNLITRFFGGFGPYQYTEKLFLPNTPLYAIGMFETHLEGNERVFTLSARNLPPRRPFLLSQKSQKQVILKYRLFGAGLLLLFASILILTLGIFSHRAFLYLI